jgi:hypothetical protein
LVDVSPLEGAFSRKRVDVRGEEKVKVSVEMNSLGVVNLKPHLTVEHYRVVDRVRPVHRRIFLFEVIG